MNLKLITNSGWTEAVIDDNCDFDKFYAVADILKTNFNLNFTDRLSDLDTKYWDFKYKGRDLTLHFNVLAGLCIAPIAFKEATDLDNESVAEIGTLLFKYLIDMNWEAFENEKTLGQKGSERGIIILDEENVNGARITLEKDCGDILFAVTFGIYGLMLHTHFESSQGEASRYISETKLKINKIFELYSRPEEQRNDNWQIKHDRLINELADIAENDI